MNLPESFNLSPDAVAMLERLRRLAIDYQVICQQAPNIWDGESVEDVRLAKKGCNGQPAVGKRQKKIPPCPIKNLCLQTALTTQSHYGVWGGVSAQERKAKRVSG